MGKHSSELEQEFHLESEVGHYYFPTFVSRVLSHAEKNSGFGKSSLKRTHNSCTLLSVKLDGFGGRRQRPRMACLLCSVNLVESSDTMWSRNGMKTVCFQYSSGESADILLHIVCLPHRLGIDRVFRS